MTYAELLDKLTNIEKLLERLVVALETPDDEASVVGEILGNSSEEEVEQVDTAFIDYFEEYGTHDNQLSLREYDYTLHASDEKRKDAITEATKYHTPSRVYYHLMALHKVWSERSNNRNDTFVQNLATDIQFVKTKYMS